MSEESNKGLSIAQVSKEFQVAESTLRYYEQAGLMEAVEKNESGHRVYQDRDLRRIRFILLLRSAGVSVQEIRHYVELVYDGEGTIPERKALLEKQLVGLKQRREELDRTILALEDIVANYESTLVKRELDRRSRDSEAYDRKKLPKKEKEKDKEKEKSRGKKKKEKEKNGKSGKKNRLWFD